MHGVVTGGHPAGTQHTAQLAALSSLFSVGGRVARAQDTASSAMAYHFNSPCVHQIPLAIDLDTSHTDGLDPRFATARCVRNFEACRKHILGPMPPNEFLDTFLHALPDADTTRRLSSKDAFRAVPSSADDVLDIWKPLVSPSYPKGTSCR